LNKRIIVFAPHPDDETLGCGGTIAKRKSEGFEVIIVLITDGRHIFPAKAGIDPNPPPEEVKRIRSEEFNRATTILGVPKENILAFDFEDGTLKKHEKEVEDRVVEILGKHSPAEMYFPFSRDSNPDHQAANRIIKRVVRRAGLSCTKYQYSITHKYARVGPYYERFIGLLRRNTVRTDISEFLDLKKRAIKEYKLEASIVHCEQKGALRPRIDPFQKDKETFYIYR
jgi:LmbE family N-acetylglucosaminyl deacetylase